MCPVNESTCPKQVVCETPLRKFNVIISYVWVIERLYTRLCYIELANKKQLFYTIVVTIDTNIANIQNFNIISQYNSYV